MENILSGLSPEARDLLHNAHSRYMVLIGIYEARDERISDECAAEDKTNFPALIKQDSRGLPIFDSEDFALFAGQLCGCSREQCLAWDEKEFFDEHGMTLDQMDKKNTRDKERVIAQEAATAVQQDRASGSKTYCPYGAETNEAKVWNQEYEFRELEAEGFFDKQGEYP